MNVKAGSGLGVGLGAGVASGVGTGIVVSVFRTRRPDCAKIAAAQIATSVIATLTLIGFEEYKQRIGSFLSVRTAGYVRLHRRKNFVGRGPSGFNDLTVAIDAGSP